MKVTMFMLKLIKFQDIYSKIMSDQNMIIYFQVLDDLQLVSALLLTIKILKIN